MSIRVGNEGINFEGKRGVNASDAVHDKDVVVLRQLRRAINSFSGLTGSTSIVSIGDGYPVYAGLSGASHQFRSFSAITPNLYMLCGDTIVYGLNDYLVITGITAFTGNYFELSATTLSAVNIDAEYYYSGGTPLDFTFREKIWCGSTGTEAVIRNNYTNNIAAGNFSIIGGAYSYSNGNFSVISGGSGNTSNGNYGFLGSGVANRQYGIGSVLVGGTYNTVSGSSSFLGSGFGNRTSKSFSVIVGGFGNYNAGVSSSILGGNFNSGLTSYSSILGGSTNLAYGNFSNITNGYRNKVYSIHGFIGNGLQNNIQTGSSFSSILNGENNLIRSGSTHAAILNGSANTINYNLGNVAILGGHSLSALSSNTIYIDHAVARSLSSSTLSYVGADIEGHLVLIDAPIVSFTGSGLTNVVNTGSTHGIVQGIYGTTAVLKSISGGSNINIFSSNTENAISLSPNVYINNLLVSGNTILSSTTAMTATILSLSGVGVQMVVTDNNGLLSTQSIPSGGSGGTLYSMVNTGLTHGIYVGMSGSNVFVLKSLSGGSNIDIFSSTTENSISLKNNIVINSLSATSISATTFYSGSTPLSNYFQYLWTASTGTQAIIRNNNTDNLASGTHSWVSGRANSATTTHGLVTQGFQNRATGVYSLVVNGKTNSATTSYSTVINGGLNISSGLRGFIGNGIRNSAITGTYAVIINGLDNVCSASFSTIINGSNNFATGSYSTVLNGNTNRTSGNKSLILNGSGNTSTSNYTNILNGISNIVSANHSFINGGKYNIVSSSQSFVLNGTSNQVLGYRSLIGNGNTNLLDSTSSSSSILNGSNQIMSASSNNSTIIGGSENKMYSSVLGAIISGNKNLIQASSQAVIVGGISNYITIYGFRSLIGNGSGNSITSNFSTVLNGFRNASNASYGTVISGRYNSVNSVHGLISNGINHRLDSSASRSAIIGGQNYTGTSADMVYVPNLTIFNLASLTTTELVTVNPDGRLYKSPFSTLTTTLGLIYANTAENTGSTHGIYAGSYSGVSGSTILVFKSLSGGNNIIITSSQTENAISLASNISVNSISANTFYSGSTQLDLDNLIYSYWSGSTGTYSLVRNNNSGNIAGGNFSLNAGYNSSINNSSHYSGILHAKNAILVYSNHSSIIAGYQNQINYSSVPTVYSTILNGKNNYIKCSYSSILNGLYNTINNLSIKSTILNGENNIINNNNTFNSILNGKNNYILSYSNYCTIVNGLSNTIYGGLNNVSIINGVNITATESNSVYVPQLFISNTYEGGDKVLTINSSDKKVYHKSLINIITGATSVGGSHAVYRDEIGNNLFFKSISGGSNINIISSSTENAIYLNDNININSIISNEVSGNTFYSASTPFENIFVTTGSTSGVGTSLFINKVGSQLNFKSLSAGTNTSLFDDGSNITINSTGGGGSSNSVNNGINTFTAGTSSFQSVNVTGLTIDNLNVSGVSEFNSISASTIHSGSTDLGSLFAPVVQHRIKTIDQTTTSSSTLVIDEMIFDIESGKKYYVDYNLLLSGTTGGMRFGLSGDTLPKISVIMQGMTSAVNAQQSIVHFTNGLSNQTIATTASVLTSSRITGLIECTGATGTFSLVWRTLTAPNLSTLLAGSVARMEKIN